MIANLIAAADVDAARRLIEGNGLTFEPEFDDLVGVHEEGSLVAVGARAGRVLKMLAIAPAHRGGSLLGEITTALVSRGIEAGFDSLFVFTKPGFASSFEALNFTLLADQGQAVLLEFGNGLKRWLAAQSPLRHAGINGAVVVNCNPFSRGHRHLIETAARQVDHLYVFVVAEDRSAFPFAVRWRLVVDGVRDIANAVVLDTAQYQISAATFPTYFLKQDDPVARIQMELDLTLFASRIAPYFGIGRRFVGSEPHCALTRSYNETMHRLLPQHGIGVTEIPRLETTAGVISASRVRDLVARNEMAPLQDYLPASTLAYLLSEEAAPIRRQLQKAPAIDGNPA
ncbi:MAG TPA: [citrate (pro-3S)-lyase] ligase [Azonexus sp.]|nr:[citrate (pro-3S)-lyase] ligase [Azonexus sp.]